MILIQERSLFYLKKHVELIRKQFEDINERLKDYCIKIELKKPFLQKLYEMFGRGLVTYRSSYLFRQRNWREERIFELQWIGTAPPSSKKQRNSTDSRWWEQQWKSNGKARVRTTRQRKRWAGLRNAMVRNGIAKEKLWSEQYVYEQNSLAKAWKRWEGSGNGMAGRGNEQQRNGVEGTCTAKETHGRVTQWLCDDR